jgi:diadenosine tetraphosphate (Ap4A) HIT family hydrolase
VIPKQEISSVFDLNESHLELLYEMKQVADSILTTMLQEEDRTNDHDNVKLVFHMPPFNSVDHLHLHVLAPVPSMGWYGKLKYWENTPWCESWQSIVDRLKKKQGRG